jgi:hypothetical protein
LQVEYLTYFFVILPIPIFLLRSLPYRLGMRRSAQRAARLNRAEHSAPGGPFHSILETVLNREVLNVRFGRSMAIGSSCLAVARKL